MRHMTAQTVSLFHDDMSFSYSRGNNLFMARKTKLLWPVEEKMFEFCLVWTMTCYTFPLFNRKMFILATFYFLLHVSVTSVTELQHWLNGNCSIFTCMSIMTGTAGVFLKRQVDCFFDFKEHVAMAFLAELIRCSIQQIRIWRCMRFMAGDALVLIYRSMYVRLEKLLLFLFVTGVT